MKKTYYRCPCCGEKDDKFYLRETKNKEKYSAHCTECRIAIFYPIARGIEFLDFVQYWQKNGDGLVRPHEIEQQKNFKPIGGKYPCPCCGEKQTTMLQRTKRGFSCFSCHWRQKCGFSVFIPEGYLYLILEYPNAPKPKPRSKSK